MTSKAQLVRNLDRHRIEGVALYIAWGQCEDETTARDFHGQERDRWYPELIAILRELAPELVARYTIVSPYEKERSGPAIFCQWGDMAGAYANTIERLDRLRADIVALARQHRVDLAAPEINITPFSTRAEAERAYADRVREYRKVHGRAPSEAEDRAWGKTHGLTRGPIRRLRETSPARTAEDRIGGNPNLAKNQPAGLRRG